MNRYVSTYQKDYTWPDTLGVRRPPSPPIGTVKDTPCRCIDVQRVLAELLDTNGEWSRDWGRAGPMGRLLEPRLYAIKIETKVPARRDRPRVCARQLPEPEEKCRVRYGALKGPFTDESARVNGELMKTTYQVDYSEPAAARLAERRVEERNGERVPCRREPIRITVEAICPSQCRPRPSICRGEAAKDGRVHKRGERNGASRPGRKRRDDADGAGRLRLPPWRSEYQDTVSKIGRSIMRAKLHHAKKNDVPSWAACS